MCVYVYFLPMFFFFLSICLALQDKVKLQCRYVSKHHNDDNDNNCLLIFSYFFFSSDYVRFLQEDVGQQALEVHQHVLAEGDGEGRVGGPLTPF